MWSSLYPLSRLEVVVDPWLEGLWKAIKGAISKMATDKTDPLKENMDDSPKRTPDSHAPDVQLNLLSLNDHKSCETVGASVHTDSKYASAAPSSPAHDTRTAVSDLRPTSAVLASQSQGTASVSTSAQETQNRDAGVPHAALAASLTCSLPPLSQSALNVPTLPPPYLDVSLQDVDNTEQVSNDAADKTSISTIHHQSYKNYYFFAGCYTVNL